MREIQSWAVGLSAHLSIPLFLINVVHFLSGVMLVATAVAAGHLTVVQGTLAAAVMLLVTAWRAIGFVRAIRLAVTYC